MATLTHWLTMVNHNNGERNTDVDSRLRQKEQEKLLFHDFLGSKTAILASTSMADHRIPPDKAVTLSTASASSAGGRGGLSSTSDLGSSLSLSLYLLLHRFDFEVRFFFLFFVHGLILTMIEVCLTMI